VNYTLDLNSGLTQVLSDGTNTYLYGIGRIAQVNTTTEYFMGDALGSVRQLTDAQGEITLANAYEPYGVLAQTAGNAQTSYGFTNEYTSQGLIYLRSRTYNPSIGRFLTKDTWLGDANNPITFNHWQYANANPVVNIDPSGHISIHFQVVTRYAARYGLIPEYTIPSTVPSTPALWPGQRRGRHVDLADLLNSEIWEVEPYSASGYYPAGHGPGQVANYLDLLGSGWKPGRYLGPDRFTSGLLEVESWWEEPGLIVFRTQLRKQKIIETAAEICSAAALAKLLEELKRRLPKPNPFPPPMPEPIPLIPIIPEPNLWPFGPIIVLP